MVAALLMRSQAGQTKRAGPWQGLALTQSHSHTRTPPTARRQAVLQDQDQSRRRPVRQHATQIQVSH